MNTFLFAAGCLAIIVGIIHSILGEVLIFNRMRKGTIVPLARIFHRTMEFTDKMAKKVV